MDDYDNEHDHDSNASSDDQEHDQEQQDDNMTMEDGDDMEVDEDDAFNEEDEDQDEDDNGGDGDQDGDQDQDQDQDQEQYQDGEQDGDQDQDQEQEQEQEGDQEDDTTTRVDRPSHSKSNSIDTPLTPKFRPRVRPEAITARLYDIVPTMAAPQATSINAIAITPDLRYWMTGGSDGYIRKYDGPGTINGKQLLTVAQRHPFVDSVTKAGILMSYWENLEPAPPNPRGGASDADRVLSPVYSLAVHREALWLLAGLESGGINLHSVRHDEGKTIHVMQEHKNAVSVLQLAPDEKTVLSGSWDKNILDWDLNTGKSIRDFRGSGGQISALEPRPLSGAPVPAEAAEENFQNDTIRPSTRTNGFFSSGPDSGIPNGGVVPNGDSMADGEESDHESLFGSPAGSLFGDGNNNMGADNPFGGDNDNDGYSHAMLEPLDDAPHADGDVTMGGDLATGDTSHQTTDHPTTDAAPSVTQDPAQTQAEQPSASDAASNHLKPQDAPQADPPRPSTAQTDGDSKQPSIHSPTLVFNNPAPAQFDPTQTSDSTFFSAAMDGTIRIWDRRVPAPLARIGTRPGVPPWCMGACWSPDGNTIYAGRRNGTVEEFNIHKATSNWQPERTLKFPAGSGAVSAVRTMVNGRHLVCASHDILRLYDLRDNRAFKHGAVPFLIVPGPPRAGVISQMYVDPTSRYMLTAAGTRGWEGSSTEVLIGYEIGCVND